jgi:hypothetical protein
MVLGFRGLVPGVVVRCSGWLMTNRGSPGKGDPFEGCTVFSKTGSAKPLSVKLELPFRSLIITVMALKRSTKAPAHPSR